MPRQCEAEPLPSEPLPKAQATVAVPSPPLAGNPLAPLFNTTKLRLPFSKQHQKTSTKIPGTLQNANPSPASKNRLCHEQEMALNTHSGSRVPSRQPHCTRSIIHNSRCEKHPARCVQSNYNCGQNSKKNPHTHASAKLRLQCGSSSKIQTPRACRILGWWRRLRATNRGKSWQIEA